MNIEAILHDLQEALHNDRMDEVGAIIRRSAADLAGDPRVLLPILQSLDRQKKDDVLEIAVAKLREFNFLPTEASIFELRAKFRAGRYSEALQVVERIASSSDHIEALRTGGRIGNLTGDGPVALRYWERLAQAAGKDEEAPLQAARIHLRRQQYAQALNWAQIAVQRKPDGLEALQIAVTSALEVEWSEECDRLLATLFKMDRGKAHKALDRLARDLDAESAARLFSFLQQQLPDDPTVTEKTDQAYSEWLVAALDHELESRELEAAAYYRAARALHPHNMNPQRALDRLCSLNLLAMREAFSSRDFTGAIEYADMVTGIDPKCFEAWQTVGSAHHVRGDIIEASVAYRRCTELDSEHAQSWLTYGLLLNQKEDRRAALQAFQTARALSDANVQRQADAEIAVLHPLLLRDANLAAMEGDIESAWQASEAARTIRDDDEQLRRLRQNLLRQLQTQIRDAWNGGASNAEALCRSYLEKAPNDLYASTVLGRTLMRSRDYAQALPVWEGISRQTPAEAHPFLQVARCCRSLKLRDKGLAAAGTALKLDPGLQEAADLAAQFKT